ncbi:MAG: 1-acyl-sn-glycerol-3-phosphate acyltransferase [Bacteroidales bacterium]|jgi:1-acyl-sn-glycerol-3-phosphate acyltransferase|nr:1-acyl-sn-glycerol-3-phosphate acyltransferase [Bacteroidales bacterium]
MKKFCHIMLKLMGYKIDTVNIAPEAKKCVLVFAPHTSLSDFLIGWMALKDMGVKTAFVMKKEAFFFPVKYIFKAMGAVPVDRQHGAHFPEFAADLIKNTDEIAFLIAPEGTRTRVDKWKKGFYKIAQLAEVPLLLGYLDYRSKRGGVGPVIYPSGDYEKDMEIIQPYYYGMHGLKKGRFNLEDKPYAHPDWLKK